MMPAGVQGARTSICGGSGLSRRPALMGWKPSTSFVGIDGFEQARGIDVRGQRKLDEDAVDLVAGVEGATSVEQFLGGDARGRRVHLAVDAELAAGFDLAADVNLRGGDFADEDDGEARGVAGGFGGGDLWATSALDLGGDGDAVEHARSCSYYCPYCQDIVADEEPDTRCTTCVILESNAFNPASNMGL